MTHPPGGHIATDRRSPRPAEAASADGRVDVQGLPPDAGIEQSTLPTGEAFELLSVPLSAYADATHLATAATSWVARPPTQGGEAETPVVGVPLYGCHVVWTPGRAAAVGPPAKLGQLRSAVVDFAGREATLRGAERRLAGVLAGVEEDAAFAFAVDARPLARQAGLSARYRETVVIRRQLAELAPAIHAPPVHPPTLVSQLGERLRDRTRLAERLDLALDRTDFAERVTEACGQRAADVALSRRQLALEWAIVVLLLVQTAMLVAELLATRSGS